MSVPLQPLDITLAFKAVGLASGLSGIDKQVASFLIDSFNRTTGQCDPGFERISGLLKISRRAAIRAVKKLEAIRFIHKVRNGSKYQRNSYSPNWALFRELDEKWKPIFFAKRNYSAVTNVSPVECQSRHVAGDKTVTQTFLTNHSNKPSLIRPASKTIKGSNGAIDRKGNSGQQFPRPSPAHQSASYNRPLDAARAAAERRWNTDLNDQYISTPQIYGEIIDAIDAAMQSAATEAELKMRGAGLVYILNQLRTQQQSLQGQRG